jgi:hypothetical protein
MLKVNTIILKTFHNSKNNKKRHQNFNKELIYYYRLVNRFLFQTNKYIGKISLLFPNITRAFMSLIASDIVSVQPMNQPSGQIYYINPKIP